MNIHNDNLEVCIDCAMLIANGEGTEEHNDKMIAHLGEDSVKHIVLDMNDCDEEYFSWRACDGCGSKLGGDRMKAAILCDHKECA